MEQGFKVAICEQLTEPKKGVKLVERDVIRVVTPGTVIDSNLLDEKTNNYIASAYESKEGIGFAYVDISAGVLYLAQSMGDNAEAELNDLLVRVKPTEILANETMFLSSSELPAYKLGIVPKFFAISDKEFDLENASKTVLQQLGLSSLVKAGLNDNDLAISACGALLNYLVQTQKRSLSHINSFELLNNNQYMQIDSNTRRNLELTETMRDRKKRGSLLWLLDKTNTSMGARTLRGFVEQPLYNEKEINNRLKGVEELIKNVFVKDTIVEKLKQISDIERLSGRISYGNFSPKDASSLLHSLSVLPDLKKELQSFKSPLLKEIYESLYDYSSIVNLLNSAIVENPPYNVKDGGVFRKGFNKELDEYLNIASTGKGWIAKLEAQEREITGIKNLKVGFNNVFGYYIEVLKSQVELVPYSYTRKQTLANAERYITEELKEIENKILNAEEKRLALEVELFAEILQMLLENVPSMQHTARHIALLDALLSLSQVAIENNYVKPTVSAKLNTIELKDGRHPVVEKLLKDEEFVPNDTYLDNNENKTMIITGPNMAGKSTYMRQVALITLMAHIGSFVPCSMANIALTDKIFTRVGASDDLAFGQSTFMVEMVEEKISVKQATSHSLVILDEVGRGTSKFDGFSIAWSVMEHLSKTYECKTLFATHYHELTELEGILPGVKNYRINVKEFNNTVIFLRKIVRGGANKSFGIEVASLAGLPEAVIFRAKEILHSLEENEINKSSSLKTVNNAAEINKNNRQNQEIANILSDIDVNKLTPLSAFEILVDLIKKKNNN